MMGCQNMLGSSPVRSGWLHQRIPYLIIVDIAYISQARSIVLVIKPFITIYSTAEPSKAASTPGCRGQVVCRSLHSVAD